PRGTSLCQRGLRAETVCWQQPAFPRNQNAGILADGLEPYAHLHAHACGIADCITVWCLVYLPPATYHRRVYQLLVAHQYLVPPDRKDQCSARNLSKRYRWF